jgi:hypothetical protein
MGKGALLFARLRFGFQAVVFLLDSLQSLLMYEKIEL